MSHSSILILSTRCLDVVVDPLLFYRSCIVLKFSVVVSPDADAPTFYFPSPVPRFIPLMTYDPLPVCIEH